MKDIYETIWELKLRKIQMGHLNYHNHTWWRKLFKKIGLEVSASLKARETPTVKQLLHTCESSIGIKCVWNYRAAVGVLILIK